MTHEHNAPETGCTDAEQTAWHDGLDAGRAQKEPEIQDAWHAGIEAGREIERDNAAVGQGPVAFLCRECDEEGWSTYAVMPHEVPSTCEFLHVEPLYASPVAAQAQPVGHVTRDSSIAHMRVNLPEGMPIYAAPVAAQPQPSGNAPLHPAVREAIEAAFEQREGWMTKIAVAVRYLPDESQPSGNAGELDERKAFEWWASDEGESPKAVERGANGTYKLAQTVTAWAVWQARAALAAQASGQDREDAAPAEWMADDGRAPWAINSLKERIKEMRASEKRCRNAFRKDCMRTVSVYFADALGESAEALEKRLAVIDAARAAAKGE